MQKFKFFILILLTTLVSIVFADHTDSRLTHILSDFDQKSCGKPDSEDHLMIKGLMTRAWDVLQSVNRYIARGHFVYNRAQFPGNNKTIELEKVKDVVTFNLVEFILNVKPTLRASKLY